MSQKVQKLVSDLEDELTQLNQQVADAERRREVAHNTAKSLEERNKQQIDSIDKSVADYKEKALAEVDAELETKKLEIKKLDQVKQGLQDTVTEKNKQCLEIETQFEPLQSKKSELEDSIATGIAKLDDIDEELVETQGILTDRLGKVEVIKEEVKSLAYTLEQMTNDKDAMQNELDRVSTDLIALQKNFDNQKKHKEDELYGLDQRLKKAQDSLRETEVKDKTIRKDWADRKLELDKREQVVRRIESRVAGAESRIEELNRYSAL